MALVGQPLPAVKAEAHPLPAGYGGAVAGLAPAAPAPAAAAQPQLAEQRLVAYSKVMKIFMQGSYDLAKEDALASLRSVLAISEQEHLSVRAAAMAEAQHHLQRHQGPGSQEMSVGHSSQPLGAAGLPGSGGTTPVDAGLPGAAPAGGSSGGGGGGAKRAAPSTASKAAAAAPRKRNRTTAGAAAAAAAPAAGAAAAAAPGGRARTGPAAPAPRAAAGQSDLDPLVGRVVLRNWPRDGGWFSGIVSDYRPETGEHCIIYDMGKPSESFEWFKIRGAPPEACQLQEERVDFAKLALPAGTAGAAGGAAGGGGKPQRTQAATGNGSARGAGGAAAGAAAGAKQQAAGSRQQPAAARQGAGASKAGAPRAAGGAKAAAGASKPAAARTAAAASAAAKPAASLQQQQQQQQPQQPAAPAAAPAQQQQPARNGKTHHAHLANGLSSHAAAVKQALAAGARPPYHLNGHALLPRRTRSWSSDEDSDDSDDE
ncbi:hypothetical protein ABPG75_008799 [Micractinium tetrahymenae]